MRALPFIAVGAGLLLLRAVREAHRPSRIITIPQIDIVGRVPAGSDSGPRTDTPGVGGIRRPLSVRFDLRVGPIEKWAVTPAVVRQTVQANAQTGILPGTGRPTVQITDVSGGYVVMVRYPDSHGDISAVAAQRAIEGFDSRLQGRIANVMVDRA